MDPNSAPENSRRQKAVAKAMDGLSKNKKGEAQASPGKTRADAVSSLPPPPG